MVLGKVMTPVHNIHVYWFPKQNFFSKHELYNSHVTGIDIELLCIFFVGIIMLQSVEARAKVFSNVVFE